MRAANTGPGAFRIEQVADPTPGAGELVVQVMACGVCGSDLHARPAMPDGTIMGHEFCGEVVAVGPGAERAWREGSRVAVLPVLSCGECSWCRAGEVAHCRAARLIGLGGSPGGFAELAVVSSALAFEVPEELPDIYGALVEPFAVGLHTARAAGISTGDDVLIMGAGPVGLTTTRWAREMGARRIVVSDPAATRRRMSEDFGASAVVDPTVDELGHDFDVVIDCVGRPGLLDRAIDATRTKGRILVAGVCVEPDPYLPVLALLKELTIGFSVYYRPDEFEHVIAAFADGRIDPGGLVTDTVALDQLGSAFDRLATDPTDSKILVDPRADLAGGSRNI